MRGQINFINGGQSEAKLLEISQQLWWDGRPISSPPVAEDIEFLCYPKQEFNANFEITIPDEAIKEGVLLYGILWKYQDSAEQMYEEKAFFWYDSGDDKWWSNMNKVPYFKNIKKF